VGKRDIAGISKEIATAGSLAVHISEKQSNMERLCQEERTRTSHINSQKYEERDLGLSVTKKRIAKDFADDELEEKRKRITGLEKMISDYIEDLTVSRLIIEFLASPDRLTGDDFDRLFMLMSELRSLRLGVDYRRGKAYDKFTLELIMPELSRFLKKYRDKLEKGREKLAYYLIPIFQDKVIFISGYAVTRMGKPVWELRSKL